MATNRNQSGWNVEDLRDREIFAAIHYLDPDSSGENGADSNSAARGICLILTIFVLSAQPSFCFTTAPVKGKPFLALTDCPIGVEGMVHKQALSLFAANSSFCFFCRVAAVSPESGCTHLAIRRSTHELHRQVPKSRGQRTGD